VNQYFIKNVTTVVDLLKKNYGFRSIIAGKSTHYVGIV